MIIKNSSLIISQLTIYKTKTIINNFRNYFSDENSNGFTTFQESKQQLQSFMPSLEKRNTQYLLIQDTIKKREKKKNIKKPQSSQ